jgi:hypothetical protein
MPESMLGIVLHTSPTTTVSTVRTISLPEFVRAIELCMGIRILWTGMQKKMICKSSRLRGARLAGAVCRGRSSKFVGCEEARYARECPVPSS